MPVCFYTLKYGVIRSNALGVAYIVLQLLSVLYLFVSVVLEQSYLEYAEVVGFVRPELTLSRDKEMEILGAAHRGELSYCARHACAFWDADRSSQHTTTDAIRLTTRVQTSHQQSYCDKKVQQCLMNYTEVSRSVVYIAAVEQMGLELHGSVQAIPFAWDYPAASDADHHPEYADSHQYLEGQLVGQGGLVLQTLPHGQVDTLTLGALLEAAGTSLDERSDSPRSGASEEHGECQGELP